MDRALTEEEGSLVFRGGGLRRGGGVMMVVGVVCLLMGVSLSVVCAQEVSLETVRAAERTVAQRQAQMREAEVKLGEADLLYGKGKLAEATALYREVVLSLKDTPMEKALRGVGLTKYEKAANEYGEQLVKEGRFDEAQKVVEELLDPAVGSKNWRAKREEKRLADDKTYNPVLTPEHAEQVEVVEELLKRGNDLIALGDFDGASVAFAQVLAHDRFNSGARRGLEKIDQLVTEGHGAAAQDETRGRMLRQVAEQWETQVQSTGYEEAGFSAGYAGERAGSAESLRSKMKSIVFPAVSFNDTPIEDVLEFLTQKSRELDTLEEDPARKGVSIILNVREEVDTRSRRVNLQLRNTPLVEILRYATGQAGLKYRVDAYAVSVVELTSESDALLTRQFRVPPDFLTSGPMGDSGAEEDPFAAPADAGASDLAPKLSAKEYLEKNGITFPEGAVAQFVPETSTLIVRNTQSNIDFIEAIVSGSKADVPRQVLVTVRVLDTSETRLKELGFGWLLAQNQVGNTAAPRYLIGGGTGGSTRPVQNPPGPTGDFPTSLNGGDNLVTGGLRSGAAAITPDNIEGALANSVSGSVVGTGAAPQLAPGVFSVVAVSAGIEVVVRMLSQQTGVDVLTAPSTVVRSGQRAEIRTVREFIYPTEYDPPELPNDVGGTEAGGSFPVTPANPTAFETREVGSILEVEPIIGPDDLTVELNLAPEFAEFIGFLNYGSPITIGQPPAPALPAIFDLVGGLLQPALPAVPASTVTLTENRIVMPVFRTIRATTNVSVYDGQTVVMGGLVQSRDQFVSDKVPLLGDVPFLGRLFRSESSQQQMRAIVLFVSVRILDPAGQPVNEI